MSNGSSAYIEHLLSCGLKNNNLLNKKTRYYKMYTSDISILWNNKRRAGLKSIHTVGEKKDSTLHRAYGVKLPYLRAVWAGQGLILPLEKLTHFFLGPWLLVCQFIDISNQTETTGEVSDIERFFLYNRALYNFFC